MSSGVSGADQRKGISFSQPTESELQSKEPRIKRKYEETTGQVIYTIQDRVLGKNNQQSIITIKTLNGRVVDTTVSSRTKVLGNTPFPLQIATTPEDKSGKQEEDKIEKTQSVTPESEESEEEVELKRKPRKNFKPPFDAVHLPSSDEEISSPNLFGPSALPQDQTIHSSDEENLTPKEVYRNPDVLLHIIEGMGIREIDTSCLYTEDVQQQVDYLQAKLKDTILRDTPLTLQQLEKMQECLEAIEYLKSAQPISPPGINTLVAGLIKTMRGVSNTSFEEWQNKGLVQNLSGSEDEEKYGILLPDGNCWVNFHPIKKVEDKESGIRNNKILLSMNKEKQFPIAPSLLVNLFGQEGFVSENLMGYTLLQLIQNKITDLRQIPMFQNFFTDFLPTNREKAPFIQSEGYPPVYVNPLIRLLILHGLMGGAQRINEVKMMANGFSQAFSAVETISDLNQKAWSQEINQLDFGSLFFPPLMQVTSIDMVQDIVSEEKENSYKQILMKYGFKETDRSVLWISQFCKHMRFYLHYQLNNTSSILTLADFLLIIKYMYSTLHYNDIRPFTVDLHLAKEKLREKKQVCPDLVVLDQQQFRTFVESTVFPELNNLLGSKYDSRWKDTLGNILYDIWFWGGI